MCELKEGGLCGKLQRQLTETKSHNTESIKFPITPGDHWLSMRTIGLA